MRQQVTQSGVGESNWIKIEEYIQNITVQVVPNSNTITVQSTTYDFSKGGSPGASLISDINSMIGLTTDGETFGISTKVTGVRINQTVGTGDSTIHVIAKSRR